MYHLFSIIATLSLVSAIPLPQYDLPTSLDFGTSDPATSIDTAANTDSFFPPAPILISEETTSQPNNPAPAPVRSARPRPRPGLDLGWDGKNRRPTFGDTTGFPELPVTDSDPTQDDAYWKSRGFPRIWDGKGTPATPDQDGGRAPPRPQQGNDAPPPEMLQDAGIAGAATSVIKGIIDGVPPGFNPAPAGGY